VVLVVVEALGAEQGDEVLLTGAGCLGASLRGQLIGLYEDEFLAQASDTLGRQGIEPLTEKADEGRAVEVAPEETSQSLAVVADSEGSSLACLSAQPTTSLALDIFIYCGIGQGRAYLSHQFSQLDKLNCTPVNAGCCLGGGHPGDGTSIWVVSKLGWEHHKVVPVLRRANTDSFKVVIDRHDGSKVEPTWWHGFIRHREPITNGLKPVEMLEDPSQQPEQQLIWKWTGWEGDVYVHGLRVVLAVRGVF
jgi:hypothetical protein